MPDALDFTENQEKWDCRGYPEGLAGEAIPLSARLMALADVCADLEARLQAVVFP